MLIKKGFKGSRVQGFKWSSEMKGKLLFILVGIIVFLSVINSDAATINVPDNFKTIHDAVENSQSGDTIIVRNGNYHENIVISKPLTLQSEKGADVTVLKPSNTSEPVIKVMDTNNVSIIGFTATGSAISGIYLYKTTNSKLLENKSIENRNGIFLYSSDNNSLTGNETKSNDQTGIYLEASNGNVVERNEADSNREKGIFLISANSNKVTDNSASLNEWNGITLWSANNNTIKGNKVYRNTYGIIMSNSTGNDVSENPTWTNFYIILPILLIYLGVLLYWVERRIFLIFYREEHV
ncbi:MAG: right-handed parallel beta-helix repeat-containing protein [Nitrospirae bacterium]|nr:right-handed parallel beta-helix repeat-containing protein [Nitrospirota bacterium]